MIPAVWTGITCQTGQMTAFAGAQRVHIMHRVPINRLTEAATTMASITTLRFIISRLLTLTALARRARLHGLPSRTMPTTYRTLARPILLQDTLMLNGVLTVTTPTA